MELSRDPGSSHVFVLEFDNKVMDLYLHLDRICWDDPRIPGPAYQVDVLTCTNVGINHRILGAGNKTGGDGTGTAFYVGREREIPIGSVCPGSVDGGETWRSKPNHTPTHT